MNSRGTRVMQQANIVGYFAYVRTGRLDEFAPEKFSVDRVQMNPEAKNFHEAKTIKSWPLTAEEFSMSLEQLAKKYPLL